MDREIKQQKRVLNILSRSSKVPQFKDSNKNKPLQNPSIKQLNLLKYEEELEELKLRRMQLKSIMQLIKDRKERKEAKRLLRYLDKEINEALKEHKRLHKISIYSLIIAYKKTLSKMGTVARKSAAKATDLKSIGRYFKKKNEKFKKNIHQLNTKISKSHDLRKQKFERKVNKIDEALDDMLADIKKYPHRFVMLFKAKKVKIKRYAHPKLSKADLDKIKVQIKSDIIKEARLARDSGKSLLEIRDTLVKKGYPLSLVQKGLKLVSSVKDDKHLKIKSKDILFELKR